MRKIGTAIAALGLAAAGLTVPATTAQAAPEGATGANCDALFRDIGRDGKFRAFSGTDCYQELGAAQGDDPNWADSYGNFRVWHNDTASSIMNNGYQVGEDVVAVYRNSGYRHADGYGCLAAGEAYADNLRDDFYYESDRGKTNIFIDNSISSHQWVYAGGCASLSWIR